MQEEVAGVMQDWHFHHWATAEAFKKAQLRQQQQVAKAKRRQQLQVSTVFVESSDACHSSQQMHAAVHLAT